jgi:FkbH-like protein
MSYYKAVWEHLGTKLERCHIFQSNIVLPFTRVMGNLESNYYFSKRTCLSLLNIELTRQRYRYVTIVDLEYMAALVGKNNWFDDSAFMLYKTGFALQYVGIVSEMFSRQIAVLQGKVRKCLVLDLDNTLWGGIVGDDGYNEIQLDPNNAAGESFLAFQKYVRDLKNRGVILAVCSKNDYETAKEAFIKNEYMILKYDDFASFVANWDDKASNLRRISAELNIGTDSLVFFDDNPAEREIIRKYLPEVEVIEVPENPADYVKVLEQSSAFERLQITEEDLRRNNSYYNDKSRQEIQSLNQDYNEYLKSLDMHALVYEPETHDMERFNQLINKSNQFNLRTIRYTESELMNMRLNKQYRLLTIKLADKFEKYGIISCIILKKEGSTLFIDSWVMSCRVFKRGIEYLAFKNIIKAAQELGCSKIIGEYIPTRKNGIVKDLYKDMGFECFESVLRKKEDGVELYVYDTSRLFDKITYFN